jgi:hypothetical protein
MAGLSGRPGCAGRGALGLRGIAGGFFNGGWPAGGTSFAGKPEGFSDWALFAMISNMDRGRFPCWAAGSAWVSLFVFFQNQSCNRDATIIFPKFARTRIDVR